MWRSALRHINGEILEYSVGKFGINCSKREFVTGTTCPQVGYASNITKKYTNCSVQIIYIYIKKKPFYFAFPSQLTVNCLKDVTKHFLFLLPCDI